MEINVAEYNDFEAIAQLHTRSWQKYYKGILKQHYLDDEILSERRAIWQTRLTNPPFNQHILKLEDNGKLCGFVCVFGNHDFLRGSMVDALHVDPDYQHQGIATTLLTAMAEWLEHFFKDSGVYLEVLAKNQQAIEFYEHIGGEFSQSRQWTAPCGSVVEELIYAWKSPGFLKQKLGLHDSLSLETP